MDPFTIQLLWMLTIQLLWIPTVPLLWTKRCVPRSELPDDGAPSKLEEQLARPPERVCASF